MTFGNFIKIMSTAKTSDGTHVFRFRRDELGVKLLNAAGITIDNNDQDFETTITKWIDRKVPKNIFSYFPNEKIDEAEVTSFFNRWTRDKWKALQMEFDNFNKNAKEVTSIVDCGTDDPNMFYQSLCDQLSMSLGLLSPRYSPGFFNLNAATIAYKPFRPFKKRNDEHP